MISFEELRLDEESPIYLQLIRYIKRGIAAGTVRAGEELPSRRVLSALLGVNPNTVQKAYRQLEDEGIIQSHAGAKSYVAADERCAERIRRELIHGDVAAMVAGFKQMGLTRAEVLSMVNQIWTQGGKDE